MCFIEARILKREEGTDLQICSQNGGEVLSSIQCVFKCDVYVNVTAYPNIVIASKSRLFFIVKDSTVLQFLELVVIKCCSVYHPPCFPLKHKHSILYWFALYCTDSHYHPLSISSTYTTVMKTSSTLATFTTIGMKPPELVQQWALHTVLVCFCLEQV